LTQKFTDTTNPSSNKEEPDLKMCLNDIEFGIVIENYIAGESGSYWEPPVDPEFEWHLIDNNGDRADWIISDHLNEDHLDSIIMYIFENSREGV